MTITPGKLRALTQPPILLRMEDSVAEAPGESPEKRLSFAPGTQRHVFAPGTIVFAQYIGNGRLLLTPLSPTNGFGSHVVMASALNGTASIVDGWLVQEVLDSEAKRASDGPPAAQY